MRNKSEEKPEPEPEPEGPSLKCPNCDNCETNEFEWCEDVTSYRNIVGFNVHGELVVSGLSENGDCGENERFLCNKCGQEFPIPASIHIEWD